MRAEERDAAYLWDMREAARDALRILGELDAREFVAPEHETVRLAIERKLEVLGEAARRVSEPFRTEHPDIPWKDIVGLRNVITHQYEKVDYKVLHGVVRGRIPDLLRQLDPLVPQPPEDDA